MPRCFFCRVLYVVITIIGILGFTGILSAQGRSQEALEHVRQIQERNTQRLMEIKDVEGTAIGLGSNEEPVIAVLTAGAGVSGIPEILEGVPVEIVVTGKFYSLQKPYKAPPGLAKRDRTPPSAPTDLMANAFSSSQINLDWNDNSEADLSHYNVYRSTSGGPYSKITSVTNSQYSNGGLMPSTTYSYVVTAVDTSNNESSGSNIASATTEAGSFDPIGPRPAPIGVSTGHPNITAGTIGCRVKDAAGNVYALSNNHVYADENRASFGDNVLQPGTYDGGENPRDAIGQLFDFEPIVFSRRASNKIDAAIAISSTAQLDKSAPSGSYGTPSNTTELAEIGLMVKKHGRTTGLTYGEVIYINSTVNVTYDTGTARFVEQIIVSPGTFSSGGDSGSLIVTQEGNHPVGLLFAGSSFYTIANPINEVLLTFGVSIDGQLP